MRNSGIGNVKSPRVDEKPIRKRPSALSSEKGIVKAMTSEARDGVTSGADNEPTPPYGSNGALPDEVRALIPGPKFHVP